MAAAVGARDQREKRRLQSIEYECHGYSNTTIGSNATNRVNGYAMFKRKRGGTEGLENERGWSRPLSDLEEEGCSKKLRLSRDQYALLEESFLKNTVPEPVSLNMVFIYYLVLCHLCFVLVI